MFICFCLCFHRCLFVFVCAFMDADFRFVLLLLFCVYVYMLSWFWDFYPFVPCFGLFCIQELLLSWRVSFLPLSSGTTAENIMSLWYSILEKQYATSAIHQRYFNILRSQTATLTLLLCLSSTVIWKGGCVGCPLMYVIKCGVSWANP